MNFRRFTLMGAAAFIIVALAIVEAFAFRVHVPRWPESTIDFSVLVFNTTPELAIPFEDAFDEAIDQWNTNSVFSFTKISERSDPCSNPNDVPAVNGVGFYNTQCGLAWGETTLAITRIWRTSSERIQSGIAFRVFDPDEEFAICWSPSLSGPNGLCTRTGGTLLDFRRVAVHELGHVIGLHHSQDENAIMQRTYSEEVETPQQDDIEGVAALFSEPENDNFAAATTLTGTSVTVGTTNINASKEVGEPNHAGDAGGRSLWWKWTAPEAGQVIVSTIGSDFDTILGIYSGNSLDLLETLRSSDDSSINGDGTSRVVFGTDSSQTYYIAVDGNSGDAGNISLSVSLSLPANDNFAAPSSVIPLTISPKSRLSLGIGFNNGATKESGEPDHAGNIGGASVWWDWTPQLTGRADVLTFAGSLDTIVGVYTGESVDALTRIASNNNHERFNFSDYDSLVTFPVTADQTYRIAVDGYNGAIDDIAFFALVEQRKNDLVLNLPMANGIWTYLNNNFSNPNNINTTDALKIVVGDIDGNGKDDIVADFGLPAGLWVWLNNERWVKFNVLTTQHMAIGDLDGDGRADVITDFGSKYGIWAKMNNQSWRRLSKSSTNGIAIGDLDGNRQHDVIGNFGAANGTFALMNNNFPWIKINNSFAPNMITCHLDGSTGGSRKAELVMNFASGIYMLRNYALPWERLSTSTKGEGFACGDLDDDGRQDLIVDFGASGLFVYRNDDSTSWEKITGTSINVEAIAVADVDNNGMDDIIADLGPGFGTKIMLNDSGKFEEITPNSASVIATGNIDGNDAPAADSGASLSQAVAKLNATPEIDQETIREITTLLEGLIHN